MKPFAYFIGIGGIGMSALARYYSAKGVRVMGYDKTPTPLTGALASEGMVITYALEVDSIPAAIQSAPVETVDVVYTPAIPEDNPQLTWLRNAGYSVRKRAEALAAVTNASHTLAIAGTHGKTTTSCMLAWLLDASGIGCNAFLGGIAVNYQSNNVVRADSSIMVAEADEYDRSFLRLFPQEAVITSVDADHLDIYGTAKALEEGFKSFVAQVDPRGAVLVHESVRDRGIDWGRPVRWYGDSPESDVRSTNLRIESGWQLFDLETPVGTARDLRLGMPGSHNRHNAAAAAALAIHAGVKLDRLPEVMGAFKGVRRRFEYALRSPVSVIDDYAHHPKELALTIAAAREMHPGKKLVGMFQPHLYSRTRDFMSGFGTALSALDEVLLLPIYPAREKPLPGIDSQCVLDNISNTPARLTNRTDYLEHLKAAEPEVILVLGAGDIDRLVNPIAEAFA